jgi:hypothetical protein
VELNREQREYATKEGRRENVVGCALCFCVPTPLFSDLSKKEPTWAVTAFPVKSFFEFVSKKNLSTAGTFCLWASALVLPLAGL